jgi:hypothetical protein
MQLARREGASDDTLPEPEHLPFTPDEMDFIYELWTIWAATDKRYLPSQLIPELQAGYGRILTGLMTMESLYAKIKAQLKKNNPNSNE